MKHGIFLRNAAAALLLFSVAGCVSENPAPPPAPASASAEIPLIFTPSELEKDFNSLRFIRQWKKIRSISFDMVPQDHPEQRISISFKRPGFFNIARTDKSWRIAGNLENTEDSGSWAAEWKKDKPGTVACDKPMMESLRLGFDLLFNPDKIASAVFRETILSDGGKILRMELRSRYGKNKFLRLTTGENGDLLRVDFLLLEPSGTEILLNSTAFSGFCNISGFFVPEICERSGAGVYSLCNIRNFRADPVLPDDFFTPFSQQKTNSAPNKNHPTTTEKP